MSRYVALLRGINVGTAKQVPMAKLRQACENLGWRNVTTVLRSGSVVFDAGTDDPPQGTALRAEVEELTGVTADVLMLSAAEFGAIAADNPLAEVSEDGSKLFTTFLSEPAGTVEVPDAGTLGPEQLSVGRRAVYQWFPDGSMASKVPKQFWSQFSGIQTARNQNTVDKILTLLSEESKKA
jgi:uncharacterized protein (DUF1697 family)